MGLAVFMQIHIAFSRPECGYRGKMREVKFGILSNVADIQIFEKTCLAADHLGYHSIALGDHVSWPTLECWSAMSAAAVIAQRLHLCQLVTNNTYRWPTVLAKAMASVDVISGGRLEIGVGAGTLRSEEYGAYGLPYYSFRERVGRLRESLDILQGLWKNSEYTFGGRYYHVERATLHPRPVQQPFPPLLIGGTSRSLATIAAERANIWNFGFDTEPGKCIEELEKFNRICEAEGRRTEAVEKCIGLALAIGEDQARIDDVLETIASSWGKAPADVRRALIDSAVGTPEEVSENIRKYLDIGVTYFFLWGPGTRSTEALRLFAERVMKRLGG